MDYVNQVGVRTRNPFEANNKMNYKLLLILLIVLNSCQSQEKGDKSKDLFKDKEVLSIKCSLKSLEGSLEIYKIKNDSIYSSGKKEKMNISEYKKMMNVPIEVYEKGGKYVCGVCTDEVDYVFLFNYADKQIKWEIEPNIRLPKEMEEYFTYLINKYQSFIKH